MSRLACRRVGGALHKMPVPILVRVPKGQAEEEWNVDERNGGALII